MKNFYTKIDKTLKKAPKRVIGMYNNLIAGIIGGTIIYYLLILKTLENIILGFFYVLILMILGFLILLNILKNIRSKKSKKDELKNYIWNVLMALLGGFYLLLVFNLGLNKILSGLILLVLFILISYFRNKYNF
ncbi:MAG: hypothetical protein AABW51_04895 [Nanoarchaeota archaeon]